MPCWLSWTAASLLRPLSPLRLPRPPLRPPRRQGARRTRRRRRARAAPLPRMRTRWAGRVQRLLWMRDMSEHPARES